MIEPIDLIQPPLQIEQSFKEEWLALMVKYSATVYGCPDGSRAVVIVDSGKIVTEFYI